ncbi:uncharacterized protein LOC100119697 isoform X1 [Nasonia vitripennis]|uniref:Ras-GEF domain-containing family member 1B n=1 Tax=Nasonia vitripennis TaxID=7425 RepID=A0A7M7QBN9_NASVI|nr:uncharacterized protein LOC100119697 isoform X1 [Nasonia vitripennis]XP_031783069.1 uncharacterized protein LOC100119697 isoform X1 [Nasonia vitripennis]
MSSQQQQQQSGSGFGIDGKPEEGSRQNGRASADIMADVAKADMSNGFERRSSSQTRQQPAEKESNAKNEQQNNHHHSHQQQQQHLEERPASVPVLLTHQPYHDNIVIDRLQFVQQGGAQPIPVHATAQYAPEYVIAAPADSLQYSQIHGAVYNAQGQYVSRDPSFRDSALYTQIAPQGATYVQQAPSGQPPTYYASKGMSAQPVAGGYVHFAPQIHYSQYPQTVMNTAPYGSQKSMYPPPPQYSQQPPQQTVSAQHSPNPQRFSHELSQYQAQPIIQPIAKNVGGHSAPAPPERPSRGPKPMVPPRINSKITHESGHRKSASVDVPNAQKSKGSAEGSNGNEQGSQQQTTQESQQGDSRFVQVTVNQSPRTRQDGLFIDANGEPLKDQSQPQQQQQQQSGNSEASDDCGIYVSRPEHRKSVSVDVTSSFQRRNDTITFTFPGDGAANAQPQQEAPILLTARKPVQVAATNAPDNNKPVLEVNSAPVFPPEQQQQQRRIDVNAAMRMSPMPVLPALSVVPKGILVSGERKSVEWSSLSPNQRIVVPQENRRSDYFEEHRRSPMTVDGKRFEEIRRSPMAFVPIRDANPAERINQKSPNNLANQAFEKTRAELAMWAEQRQRQEIESRISMQGREMFTTSPRSRNPSEERRPDSRSYIQVDKETRMAVPSSAFQPIANITPSSIMEQRRHLRHVSADLTKHMDLTRKEFDDQHLTGSVINLGTTATSTATANVMSQRASPSPNICFQYPALSEAKLDTKMALSIVTDFNEPASKPLEQVDHIIHSHRKSQNHPQNILSIAGKGHENSQNHSEQANDKSEGQPSHSQQILHNQQSIDFISEKLSQCERQQSDLQAKLQSLQSQNEILDKVAQYQYQQNDLQTRMHSLQLQSQIAEKLSQKQSSEFSQSSSHSSSDQEQTNKVILNQCINASRQLYGQPLLTTVPPQMHASYISERVSPRLQFQEDSDCDSMQIPSISQMPLPSLTQFDRADVLSRGSYTQLQQRGDNLDSIPCSQMSLASLGSLNFTGTLKKVPPEKPPRTSLIVQSPDTESNRSQPAIGLKHTSKARPTIFGTVASDLNPKDGNSRRSLPQTPAGSLAAKAGSSGVGGAGMVNGSGANHPDARDAAAISAEQHELVYRDGNLVSGSLDALVQHMVPTEEYYPDRAYLFAFLLSARLFIKPHELLGEVCALCEHQQNLNGEGGKERLHRFVPRLVQLLAEWTETFPYDFRDERVMGHVRSITQKVANVDAAARQEVSVLLQNLLLKLTALERYEEALQRLATEANTEQLTQVDVTELCPSATVLAQQLTHVELERLSYIGPEEFVQAFAKESPHLETSFKDMKKTRNLESYVQWFNRLSYFVATEVCKHAKKKQRVRVVEYWIETARECFNIGNFNSLMAIIAGLNMSPISRLKKTWSKVQSAKFSILEHQMDPSSNFSSYRSTLKAAMWRSAGATDERQRIVVPFFSLLVKDLYFLNEGCSNKLPNGHINFEKFWQLAKQVTEFIAWKQVACPFEKNPRVIAFIQASPVLTENALALASFDCEPPDNNHEKDRYKLLKAIFSACPVDPS